MIFSNWHLPETMSVYNAMSVVQNKLVQYSLFCIVLFSKVQQSGQMKYDLEIFKVIFGSWPFGQNWFSPADICLTPWVCIMCNAYSTMKAWVILFVLQRLILKVQPSVWVKYNFKIFKNIFCSCSFHWKGFSVMNIWLTPWVYIMQCLWYNIS